MRISVKLWVWILKMAVQINQNQTSKSWVFNDGYFPSSRALSRALFQISKPALVGPKLTVSQNVRYLFLCVPSSSIKLHSECMSNIYWRQNLVYFFRFQNFECEIFLKFFVFWICCAHLWLSFGHLKKDSWNWVQLLGSGYDEIILWCSGSCAFSMSSNLKNWQKCCVLRGHLMIKLLHAFCSTSLYLWPNEILLYGTPYKLFLS